MNAFERRGRAIKLIAFSSRQGYAGHDGNHCLLQRGRLLKHPIAPESLNTAFNLDGVIKLASRFVLLSAASVLFRCQFIG
jgi:hypothetical protein